MDTFMEELESKSGIKALAGLTLSHLILSYALS